MNVASHLKSDDLFPNMLMVFPLEKENVNINVFSKFCNRCGAFMVLLALFCGRKKPL